MRADKPLKAGRRGAVILAGLIVLVGLVVLSRSSYFVEEIYARRISSTVSGGLSRLTGHVPVSLAEIALGVLVLYAGGSFCVALVQVLRRERSIGNAVANGLLRSLTAIVVILAAFYVLWGVNYERAPLAKRLGWTAIEQPVTDDDGRQQTDEIAELTEQLILATNEAYRQALETEDLGRPSRQRDTAVGLDATLEAAYVRVQQQLGLEPEVAARRGMAKPLEASPLLNHLRLGGFYFPWTGEANYNRLMPGPDLPHAVAHEKAHQRGIALEDEANFIGFVACTLSDDPYVRYSGFLFGHQQLLGELARRDRARARALLRLRLKGVQRDIDFVQEFWRQYEGRAALVSETVNNTYLKSQGERRGTRAYAASRSLIVLYARQNGGRVPGRQ